MPTISLTSPTALTVITAGLHSTNYNALATLLNGGLDNANIAVGANIDTTKLNIPGGTTSFLRSDGNWAAPTSEPAGVAYMWFFATAPTNHALVDGSTLTGAQTNYPSLWANIDSTWKSGSDIILPDLRGRVPVGKGTHTEVDALGDNDGTTLANRRPRHATAVFTSPGDGGGTSSAMTHRGSGAMSQPVVRYLPADSHTLSGAANGIVSSTSEPVDQPAYLVVNWIIKLT